MCYKIHIYSDLSKGDMYCLLIQFSKIKSLVLRKSCKYIVEYFNKKDMQYSIEMLDTIKINGKYIKYKTLENNVIYLKMNTPVYCKIDGGGKIFKMNGNFYMPFYKEEKIEKALEDINEKYVNYKRIKASIVYEIE